MLKLRKLKRFFRTNNVLVKITFSYMLLAMVILPVFAYVLTGRVSESLIKATNENSQNSVYQSFNTAEALINSTYNYFYQVFDKDELIFDALYANRFDPVEIGKINNKLNDMVTSNILVHSVYIINPNTGLVFSSSSTVREIEEFYDYHILELIKKADQLKSGFFIPRQVQLQILDKRAAFNFISIPYFRTSKNNEPQGVLVVNIDQQLLQKLLVKGMGENSVEISIINDNGTIITHPDVSLLNRQWTGESFFRSIIDTPSKQGTFIDYFNKKKSLFTFVKSDRLGWNFIGITDYDNLLGKVARLRKFILLITIMFALLAITCASYFTSSVYRPIYKLIKKVSMSAEVQKTFMPLSEVDYLSASFTKLFTQIEKLQTDVRDYLPIEKKDILRCLLRGQHIQGVDLCNRLKKLEIRLDARWFAVCIIKIDSYDKLFEQYSMMDISLLKYGIANIAKELLEPHYWIEIVEDEEDNLSIILNIEEEEQNYIYNIKSIMKDVQDNVKGFLKLSVTIAVGTVVEGLEDLKYSWSSAHQAARYRLVLGAQSVIAYNELPTENKPEYIYPLSTEKYILNSLKLGDLVKLESYMGEFINEVRQFSSDEIMLAFAQLLVMTERTCKLIDNGTNQDTLLELTTFQKQLHIQDTLEQLGEWYLSFCSKIIELQTNVLSIKNTEATERMITYIQKNYGDPVMSVEVIAEHVGLSTNYARKVFKDYAHESLSVYISNYRFEKARMLLLTTDDPANKICELVGMSNTAYFYQAFKKHFGKTPDQMRREYNVNNDKA